MSVGVPITRTGWPGARVPAKPANGGGFRSSVTALQTNWNAENGGDQVVRSAVSHDWQHDPFDRFQPPAEPPASTRLSLIRRPCGWTACALALPPWRWAISATMASPKPQT